MVRIRWWLTVCALPLALGISLARAEEKKPTRPELLPAPKCCEVTMDFCCQAASASKQLAGLNKQFNRLFKEGKYQEAEKCAACAHQLDPDNPWPSAAALLAHALQKHGKVCCDSGSCPVCTSAGKTCAGACPGNTASQKARASAASCTKCSKQSQIERQLKKIVSNVDFKDTPLRQVLDELAGCTGISIVVDEPALVEAGISLDRPLTMKVEGVAAKSVLNLVLRQAGLDYTIKDEVLNVTTPAHAQGKLQLRTYAVEDLLPTIIVDALNFQMTGATVPCPVPTDNSEPKASSNTLMKLITNTISPQSWDKVGGTGSIEYFPTGKSLVINQTPDVQEQVSELLDALRHLPKPQPAAPAPPATEAPAPPAAPQTFYERRIYEIVPNPVPAPLPGVYEPVQSMPASVALGYAVPAPVSPPTPAVPPLGPCYTVPTEAPTWVLRTTTENGKTRLEMYTPSSATSATCNSLSMKLPGSGRLKVAAAGKQVQLTAPSLAARADRMASTGRPGYLLLQGHVQLSWKKDGMGADVSANEVILGLADGHLEVKPATPVPAPSQPVVQPASASEFGFWTGFFH